MTAAQTVYVDFQGSQVSVSSASPEVIEYVRSTFVHMMVPAESRLVGQIKIEPVPDGFVLITENRAEYPATLVDHFLPLLKDEVRLQFMRAHPELLWLHAGAIAKNGRATLIAAPSGQGKSTLSTLLVDKGWRFLSDDVAPIRMTPNEVLPFPQRPFRRVNPKRLVPMDDVGLLRREGVDISPTVVHRVPAPIAAIVIIEYDPATDASISRLPAGSGALEVLRNLTNFVDHKAGAVGGVAELARAVPIYALRYASRDAAAVLVDQLL